MHAARSLSFLLLALSLSLAQDNPVTNGSFETLGPDGVAVDWQYVGATVGDSEVAHSGQHSLRLRREVGQAGEVGLNRAWAGDSGQQGKMLSERHGALEFWYRIVKLDPDCTISIVAIAMDSTPLEKTGATRRMLPLPRSAAGDGQWHRGVMAYNFEDFEKARWVHLGARLAGPGAGEVLLDDLRWLPEAGPLVGVHKLRLEPGRTNPWETGTVVATLTNVGDQPLGPVQLSLTLPPGLTVGEPDTKVAGLAADTYRDVTWPLRGQRGGTGVIALRATAGDSAAEEQIEPHAEAKLRAVLSDPLYVDVGDRVEFHAIVDEVGTGRSDLKLLQEPLGFEPAGPSQVALKQDPEMPRRYHARWSLRAVAGPRHALRVRAFDGQRQVAEEIVPLRLATSKVEYPLAIGALRLGETPDGAVGRLVADGRILAELPHLGRVVYRSGLRTESVRAKGYEGRGGELTARVKDPDGGTWTFRLIARPGPTPELTALSLSASCNRNRQVVAFYGPDLYVPGQRGEALFPGLEWLAPGELSSNDREIAEDHELHLRYVTHPNNVTVPLMTVAADNAVVGLLWDAHQRWTDDQDRPQPVFASPDRFGHQAASRMGLMAPTVLTGLEANQTEAATPLLLPAEQSLVLSAQLYGRQGTTDVLAPVVAWFQAYRPEPVMPLPHTDLAGELAFSAGAYLESLWDADSASWWSFLGGPALNRKLHRSAAYCYDLLQIANLAPNQPVAAAARARAEQILSSTRAVPAGSDLGYYAGDPSASLQGTISAASGTLRSREPDGGWSYRPGTPNSGVFKGKDFYLLGKPGDRANGLVARKIADVLRAARLTGDVETYQSAVPTLELLTRFPIPRAAQVWEVPVHAPDILAAADACEAFCEAYLISGERRWLDEARRQALSGVPFVYVWGDPTWPWMRYGSIPVFGATWYRGAWYGRVVQWNGLRYARALLQLDAIDPESPLQGLTWRELARGLVVSGLYQQREDEGYVGLWPDALGCRDGSRANWEFSPRQILELLYELNGRPEAPRTAWLQPGGKLQRVGKLDGGLATINACAEIVSGEWTGDELTVTFRQPAAPASVRASVGGLSKPTAVLVDGQAIQPVRELRGVTSPGWRYDPTGSLITVVLPAAETATVTLRGVTPAAIKWQAETVTKLDFQFDDGTGGWQATHDVETLRVEGGWLVTRSTGGDPYLIRSGCDFAPDSVKRLKIRLKVTAEGSSGGQFFWTTATEPSLSESKSLHFEISKLSEPVEVILELGQHPLWAGQRITSIRIDPTSGPTAEVAIDAVVGE